jgi:hypothetical protein
MAERARRYDRGFRARNGVTAAGERIAAAGAEVRAGPFRGLRYPRHRIAEVDTPAGKLLGTYEHEIQMPFATAIARAVTTFVDVGCADGYYAVGMPVACPTVTTYAFDLAPSARDLCRHLARLNGVESRVRIGNQFTTGALDSLDMSGALLLCDIEGGEDRLFDAPTVRALERATVVIEVHETVRPGLSADLVRRFSATHDHQLVHQAPREHDMLEYRPPELHWLIFEARTTDATGDTGGYGLSAYPGESLEQHR